MNGAGGLVGSLHDTATHGERAKRLIGRMVPEGQAASLGCVLANWKKCSRGNVWYAFGLYGDTLFGFHALLRRPGHCYDLPFACTNKTHSQDQVFTHTRPTSLAD